MKLLPFLLPFLLLGTAAPAPAQEPPPIKEAPPSLPLIAGAPAHSQWTMTYKPKPASKGTTKADEIRLQKLRQRYNPEVLTKRVLKGPDQTVIYTSYEAGLKSETWVVGGYTYELPLREGEGVHVEPRAPGDFPEISWVSAANFRGTVKLKKRKVYLYETNGDETPGGLAQGSPPPVQAEPDATPPRAAHQRAYIDAETRLPVEVDAEDAEWTYQFADEAPVLPPMDERIKQQLKSANE